MILIHGCYNISHFYGIVNGVDEFGYLSNARYMLGINNWHELSGTLSYYSFGYSLILIPLVHFINDSTVLFRSVIVLNVLLIFLSYLMTLYVGKKINNQLSNKIIIVAAFISNMYLSNFLYAKYVFTENFLTFMFWIELFFLIKLIDKCSYFYIVSLGITSSFMFWVHQRMIVIELALFLVLIVMVKKGILSYKKFMIFCLVTFCMFVVATAFKNSLIKNVYTNNINISNNDFSGQLGKIEYLFTSDGMFDFILGFLSKTYYFFISCLFLNVFGIISISSKIWKMIKKIKVNLKKLYIYLFILLCFIFSMLIQTIFLIIPNRYDLVIYGRYIEFMYGILIFEGITYLLHYNYLLSKVIPICTLFIVVGGLAALHLFEEYNLELTTSYLAPAVFPFFQGKYELKDAMLLSIVCVMFLVVLLYIMVYKIKNKKVITFLVGFITLLYWGYSCSVVTKNIVNDQLVLKDEYITLVNSIDDKNVEIFFLKEQKKSDLQRIRQIQYLISNRSIKIQESYDLEGETIAYIITENKTHYKETILKHGGHLICKNYRYSLWKI